MNIDIKIKNNDIDDYLNNYAQFGYKPYINEITRWTHLTQSCINHNFIKNNIQKFNYEAKVIVNSITDHYPTTLKINLNTFNQNVRIRFFSKEIDWFQYEREVIKYKL